VVEPSPLAELKGPDHAAIRRACVVAATLALAVGAGIAPVRAQTPEQKQLWEAQQAQTKMDEQARAEKLNRDRAARKADPMAWVHTLDPLAGGGWTFRGVGPDGSWAVFSTDHQLKRSGHMVTMWLRREFAEPQQDPDGNRYLSDVEKVQFQCEDPRTRTLLVIYYTMNDLRGSQHSEEADAKQAPWSPIVPGTQDESSAQWACAAAKGGRP